MRVVEDYYQQTQQVDENEFNAYLRDSFITISDQYSDNNDHKSKMLTMSSRWMMRLIGGAAVIAVVFLGNYLLNNFILFTTVTHGNRKTEHADTRSAKPASATITAATDIPATDTSATAPAGGTRSKKPDQAQVK